MTVDPTPPQAPDESDLPTPGTPLAQAASTGSEPDPSSSPVAEAAAEAAAEAGPAPEVEDTAGTKPKRKKKPGKPTKKKGRSPEASARTATKPHKAAKPAKHAKPAKPAKPPKPDDIGLAAVEVARAGLLELVSADHVGEHLAAVTEGKRVTTHQFVSLLPGYRGWAWSVTLTRAPKHQQLTVAEVVLLPGEEAILAPAWVPWRQRIQPGDLSPGDLLPTEDGDPRLVPGYTAGDERVDRSSLKRVSDEVGLGRKRVLSLEGRDAAAQRWYDSEAGPTAPIAQSAPGRCISCGFLVRLAGPLATQFGVCANGQANDDGRVVALNHGCGAHSEAKLGRRHEPVGLPDPYFDTIRRSDLDRF